MPALTGAQYIDWFRDHPPNVWIDGERVKDVVAHPAFRNNIRTMASLYDMQHDPVLHDEMTYCSPTSGEPVGLSFIQPANMEELEARGRMMFRWARATVGMMGRSPDFMNVTVTAFGSAKSTLVSASRSSARTSAPTAITSGKTTSSSLMLC